MSTNPGQVQWISCYIFHNMIFEKIIQELIKPLCEKLMDEKKIESFFFIRYWENGPHIRLRLLPINKHYKENIVVVINETSTKYFKGLKDKSVFYKIEYFNYIQELLRYGGDKNMRIAEKHFENSSRVIIHLIDENFKDWDYSLAISFALQMHLIFAKEVTSNLEDAILFFDLTFKNWLNYSVKVDQYGKISQEEIIKVNTFFEESYLKQRHTIDTLIRSIWQNQYQEEWMKEWINSCRLLDFQMTQAYEANKIVPPDWFRKSHDHTTSKKKQLLWSIYDSFFHMTNNRLGIYLRDEAFIAFLLLKSLKSIKIQSCLTP